MYSGLALSLGLIRVCRSGVVLSRIGFSYAGGENDGGSAITERLLLTGNVAILIIT